MDTPTAEEVASFIESEWPRARDVKVEFVRVNTAGEINAWTTWVAEVPVDYLGQDTTPESLSQNVKLRQTEDGKLYII